MKRYYPEGRAAAQVLGVTDPDGNGVAGLELGLDGSLARRTMRPSALARHAGAIHPGA